jgi:hypothetical protein
LIFLNSLCSQKLLCQTLCLKKEHFFGKWIVGLGLAKRRNQLERWIGKKKEQSDVMVVKAVRRKSNKEILFVEAGEDFANFNFSLRLSAWIISIAINALSRIERPSTKVDCSSATHLSKNILRRFASSFETTLYKTLQSDIGLKSFMVIGFSHFLIKQIIVSLIEEGK